MPEVANGALVRIIPVLAAYGAAAVTPGASVIVVARTSLASGRFRGAQTALGVALGTALYASASLFGLSTMVRAVPGLLRAVQVLGALYLAAMGLKLLFVRRGVTFAETRGSAGTTGAFARGLLTNLSNPHTVVFFVGVFGVMLQPSVPGAERMAVLLAVVTMSVSWYTAVALALSSPGAQRVYERAARALDALAGIIMLYFAARFGLLS
jgi:threonine/homoserine/homoserine lactone efflux protein